MSEPRTESQRIEDRIVTALATIRREWDHMLPTAAPAQRIGGGSRSAQITADDHADTDRDIDPATRLVSLRREVRDVLNGWSRVVMEDRPVTKALPDGLSVPSMATFLERHARWVCGHEAAPDMADELKALAQEVARRARPSEPAPADYTPPRPRPRLVGTCPLEWEALDDEQRLVMRVCEGDVLAYPTPFTDPTRAEQMKAPLPTCDRCGTGATLDWWYAQMYGDHGVSHLVTVDELIAVIAVRLDWIVTRGQVRQWKHRGKIAGEGRDAKGRTLYRHDDVIEAVRDEIEREKAKRA